uniref:M20/M25/M40 family metallo-hydrolase n=1 Tax=uncultured Draconibacterium sp. TaxID=1573823 RepID=UPI003217EF68
MKKVTLLFLLVIGGFTLFAQSEVQNGLEAITEEAVQGQLEFLASDWTEGREVGTKGAYMAADYIASMFKTYGVKPFGDEFFSRPSRAEMKAGKRAVKSKSYFQNFSLIKYEPGEEQLFSVISDNAGIQSTASFGFQTDFYVNTGSIGQSAKAPLVFVGYGFVDEEEGYNDLNNIELKGKIAVVLRGFPGHRDTTTIGFKKFEPQGRYASYYMERNKSKRLKDAGAIAVIHVDLENDPTMGWAANQIYPLKGRYYEADERLKSYYDSRIAFPEEYLDLNLPSFTVTQRVANHIFSGTKLDIESFERSVAQNLKPASQELTGKLVGFKTTVKSQIIKARNVVGIIEGRKKDEFIVVGGHYDHLGKYNGWIWNGADDNASGTVGVMTMAKAFMATGKQPEKSVIFAAWTGEEKGLLGSNYFVKEAMEKDLDVVLNVNYDMIARDQESDSLGNQARMGYTKANSLIGEITKKHIDDFNINLDLQLRASEKPGGGSDHAPFANEEIPVLYFMAAMHPDYHAPSDELDKINWEKMTNIIRIGFLNTWEFANTEDWKNTNSKSE